MHTMHAAQEEQKLWSAVRADMQVTLSQLEFGALFKNTDKK